MGKRPAGVGLFGGNMVSMQWETRPSMQRDEPPTMETGPEQIADGRGVRAPAAAFKAALPLGGARCLRVRKSTLEERSAGKLHATFCGRRRRVTASADPVTGDGPLTRHRARPRLYQAIVCWVWGAGLPAGFLG